MYLFSDSVKASIFSSMTGQSFLDFISLDDLQTVSKSLTECKLHIILYQIIYKDIANYTIWASGCMAVVVRKYFVENVRRFFPRDWGLWLHLYSFQRYVVAVVDFKGSFRETRVEYDVHTENEILICGVSTTPVFDKTKNGRMLKVLVNQCKCIPFLLANSCKQLIASCFTVVTRFLRSNQRLTWRSDRLA